jgi:lipopolysaccharide/colanic/teichoic acid biosynthesis glycosyltransferase
MAQAMHENSTTFEESLVASEVTQFEEHSLSAGSTSRAGALLECWRYRFVKRTLDFLSSLFMILVFAIPGLVICAIIALTSEGPIFYREERIGRDGRPFRIWKFRSMYSNATDHARIAGTHPSGKVLEWRMRKHLQDPRITVIGRFLRSWSLDELPQLFNILRGEMSLVGPRPIVEAETVFYGDLLPFYLAATPGLSGLWQVSGRSHIDYAERARLDETYVRSWSLRSDFVILFRTIPAVLSRKGAL